MSNRKDEEQEGVYLWNLFLKGYNDALGKIYDKYAKNLFLSGLQISKDREIIKDCIQDLFVHLYTTKNRHKPIANLRLFLFVSFRNRLYNILKRENKNLPTDSFLDIQAPEEMLADRSTPEVQLIEQENIFFEKKTIEEHLKKLTLRQREVIYYRFFESMTIEEISTVMDMNPQSVQNLIQRALNMLKK